MSRLERERLARRATARVAFAAAVLTAVFLAVPLAFGSYYFDLDLGLFDYGMLCGIRHQLSSGGGLLLGFTLGNGAPLLADPQSQLFYPLRWIVLAFPVGVGASLGPILHLAIAAGAAAWLARTFRLPPSMSLFAGLFFAFSGAALDLIRHAAYVVGAAYLPLAWAATRSILGGRARTWSHALLIAAFAGCLLGGEPQSFAIGAAISLGEAILAGLRGGRRVLPRVGAVGLSAAAASLIGAGVYLGALAEMPLTLRASGLSLEKLSGWAFEPELWLASIVPGLWVQRFAVGTDLWGLLKGAHVALPWDPSPYLGPLLLVGAIVGSSKRVSRSALAVLCSSIGLALGQQTPLFGLAAKWIPGISLFRYPQKYLVVASLAAAILAAVGLRDVVRRGWRSRVFVASAATAVVVLLAGWGSVRLSHEALDRIGSVLAQADGPTVSGVLAGALLQAVAPLGLALLLSLAPAPRARQVIPVLAVADLLMAATIAVNVGPPLIDARSQVSSLPKEARLCVQPKLGDFSLQGAEMAGAWEHALMSRVLDVPNWNACDDVVSGVAYSSLQTAANAKLSRALDFHHLGAARALGCSHLLSDGGPSAMKRPPVQQGRPDESSGAGGVGLSLVPDPLPEVFVSSRPMLVGSESELVSRLLEGASAQDALNLVDDPLERLGRRSLPGGGSASVAQFEWPMRHRAVVTLSGGGGALVGVRTSFQAGWTAVQSGKPLEVVRVAGSHVAAVVEDASAGPVEFRYRFPHRFAAVACAIAGLVLAAAVLRFRAGRRTAAENGRHGDAP